MPEVVRARPEGILPGLEAHLLLRCHRTTIL